MKRSELGGGGAPSPLLGNSRSREEQSSPYPWVVTCREGSQRVDVNGTWKLMEGGVKEGENAFLREARRGIWLVSESRRTTDT